MCGNCCVPAHRLTMMKERRRKWYGIYISYMYIYVYIPMISLQKRKAELAKIELGCELLRQKLNAPPEEEKPTLATRRTTMYSRSSFTSDYDDYHDWEDEHNDDHGFSPIDSPSPRESIRRSKEKAEMWRQKESIVLARKLASVQLEEENIEGESEESEIFTASSGSSKGSVVSKKKTSKTKVSSHKYIDKFDLSIYRFRFR